MLLGYISGQHGDGGGGGDGCVCDDVDNNYYFCFFAVALRSNTGHGLLILEFSRSHTTTHHSR